MLEPVQVQAASLAVVTVRGCNSVGLCTPVIARPVPVDLTPPIAGAVLAGMEPRLAYALSAIVAGRNALVPRE